MIDVREQKYTFVFLGVKHSRALRFYYYYRVAAIAPGKVHYPQRLMNKVYSRVTRVHACKR